MKVISLAQPFASLCFIKNPETGLILKSIETRSWNTKHRGPLLIHASKSKKYLKLCGQNPFISYLPAELCYDHKSGKDIIIPKPESLPYGAIIGSVDLVHTFQMDKNVCEWMQHSNSDNKLEFDFGDWKPGRYGWQFKNPVLFKKPIPAKGQLGIWNCESDLWNDIILKSTEENAVRKS